MKFTTILLSTALALSSGAHAWTKNGAGVWVANDTFYTIRGIRVHESCTRMNDANTIYNNNEYCAYWIDGAGNMFKGHCKQSGATVYCR